jgi:ubiquinone/menaquinone biosynthesis C-methylase UbiE
MAMDVDPEGRETQALFAAAGFRDARVLEIGCGGGRLTRRYASSVRSAVGVDSALEGLVTAKHECPADLTRRLAFVQTGARALPFRGAAFDVVLFGWSL